MVFRDPDRQGRPAHHTFFTPNTQHCTNSIMYRITNNITEPLQHRDECVLAFSEQRPCGGWGGLLKRANEPNGNLGNMYRYSDCEPRQPLTERAKRANEANASLGKNCRLFICTLRQAVAKPVGRANEPNGNLGNICRSAHRDSHRWRGSYSSQPNEPNDNLGKDCRLLASRRRSWLAGRKQQNKAISVIANRQATLSCVHARTTRACVGLAVPQNARGRRGIMIQAPGPCRYDRSDDRCGRTSGMSPATTTRRRSACLTRAVHAIRMSACLERARLPCLRHPPPIVLMRGVAPCSESTPRSRSISATG